MKYLDLPIGALLLDVEDQVDLVIGREEGKLWLVDLMDGAVYHITLTPDDEGHVDDVDLLLPKRLL